MLKHSFGAKYQFHLILEIHSSDSPFINNCEIRTTNNASVRDELYFSCFALCFASVALSTTLADNTIWLWDASMSKIDCFKWHPFIKKVEKCSYCNYSMKAFGYE